MTATPVQQDSLWSAQSWLQANGWTNVNPDGQRISLWRRGRDEVAVPLLTAAPDFTRRWWDLVTRLASLERSTPEGIQEGFLHEGADISEWRAAHGSFIDGTIPVSALHALTGTVKASVVAAANATLSPRGHFGHSVPRKAREAADLARAGQTRRGSYVIPVISRLPSLRPDPDQALDIQADLQPYQRQVMVTMSRAITAVHELTVEAGSEPSQGAVNAAVGVGVSHELCAALADSLQDPSIGSLAVSFRWARALPTAQPSRTIEFPAEAGEVVRHVADKLKDSETVGEQRLIGSVRRTERGDDEELGSAIIRANLGGSERSVRMQLTDDEFHLATTALDQRRPIFARGIVERRSGSMWLFRSVHEFNVVDRLSLADFERYLDSST